MSSSNAYASIQHALEKTGSPLAGRSVEIFLQGSYGNHTNIYGDSDVDVVVLYGDTFHYDWSALTPFAQQLHAQIFPNATYTWQHLRDDVLASLRAHYGTESVQLGKKSIKVQTAHSGRPSDVIPAIQFRKYATFNSATDLSAHWGIQFFDSSGNAIVNYPKYHTERGAEKNRDDLTAGKFKPVVRIFKNLRNHLVDRQLLGAGVAPSYFIECALHNVPNELFKGSYEQVVPAIITRLSQMSTQGMMCQNGVTPLIGLGSTQWSADSFAKFVAAADARWKNWS